MKLLKSIVTCHQTMERGIYLVYTTLDEYDRTSYHFQVIEHQKEIKLKIISIFLFFVYNSLIMSS